MRLYACKVNLYTFQRRKCAWDEFLLFVDVLYFSSLVACNISNFEFAALETIIISMPYVQHKSGKNKNIAPYFEALKVGLHIFLFEFDISIISIWR